MQEVAQAAKLDQSDSASSGVMDRSMQRTSTSFKNRSGFRGVRRVGPPILHACLCGSLTEPLPDVLCFLNCCACGRHTIKHHSCKCMKRLLCDAFGTNSCDSVSTLLCFSIMLSMEAWHCSRLLKCMLHGIACVQTQPLLITAILTF